jgi:hypothetical protein
MPKESTTTSTTTTTTTVAPDLIETVTAPDYVADTWELDAAIDELAVFIRYEQDTAPTMDHPSGFVAGETFEVPSVKAAKTVHPDARIVAFADGMPYSTGEARKRVNAVRKAQDTD